MFFWMSGVWDATMKRRMVGFLGMVFLFLVIYFGALANGVTLMRLAF